MLLVVSPLAEGEEDHGNQYTAMLLLKSIRTLGAR